MQSHIDIARFSHDLRCLHKEALAAVNDHDFKKLKRIERLGRFFTLIGFFTAWYCINPLTIICISLGISTRWMIAHQVLHRGYDRVPNIPHRYTSKGFAQGWRRYIDWLDWIHPSAWVYEHNILHHCYTGEDRDPDVVEIHTKLLRDIPLPKLLKYFIVFIVASTWKFFYYAPSTFNTLDPRSLQRKKIDDISSFNPFDVFIFYRYSIRQVWLKCYLPYGLIQFILVPMIFFLMLGKEAAGFVLINRLFAEWVANIHSFLVILPNHTAPDLLRFNFHYQNRSEFYLTQILSTVNYRFGTPLIDYLQFWLNYQIEHHLFPDLPMTSYHHLAPKVQALCAQYGIPYQHQSLWKRLPQMIQVFIGDKQMKIINHL